MVPGAQQPTAGRSGAAAAGPGPLTRALVRCHRRTAADQHPTVDRAQWTRVLIMHVCSAQPMDGRKQHQQAVDVVCRTSFRKMVRHREMFPPVGRRQCVRAIAAQQPACAGCAGSCAPGNPYAARTPPQVLGASWRCRDTSKNHQLVWRLPAACGSI